MPRRIGEQRLTTRDRLRAKPFRLLERADRANTDASRGPGAYERWQTLHRLVGNWVYRGDPLADDPYTLLMLIGRERGKHRPPRTWPDLPFDNDENDPPISEQEIEQEIASVRLPFTDGAFQARAADDAVLFLWTTSPLLFACQPVFQAWGFTYKAAIIWDKVRGVCGSYVDVRHELLLICTRGSCVPDRLTPAIDSVQTIQKSRVHSQKPDQFYDLIERLYDGPYLELFARRPRAGWTSFGNDPALSDVA